MKTGNLSRKKLSEERQRVRQELDDWGLRLQAALLGARIGTHTAEQLQFVRDKLKALTSEMKELNQPAAKQLLWVGHGFNK